MAELASSGSGSGVPKHPFVGIRTSGSADIQHVKRLARAAEENGLGSFWLVERLWPVENYLAALAGSRAGRDPLVSLAALSAVTEHLRLGVAVLVAPLRNPAILQAQVHTLNEFAGGRLVLGLGAGWSRGEFERVGVPFNQRGARYDAVLDALLLSDTDQDSPMPLLFGGGGPIPKTFSEVGMHFFPRQVVNRLARMNGWIVRPTGTATEITRGRQLVEQRRSAKGRSDIPFRVVQVGFGYIVDQTSSGLTAHQAASLVRTFAGPTVSSEMLGRYWVGAPEQIIEQLLHLIAAGVDELIFHPIQDEEQQLSQWANLIAPVLTAALSKRANAGYNGHEQTVTGRSEIP